MGYLLFVSCLCRLFCTSLASPGTNESSRRALADHDAAVLVTENSRRLLFGQTEGISLELKDAAARKAPLDRIKLLKRQRLALIEQRVTEEVVNSRAQKIKVTQASFLTPTQNHVTAKVHGPPPKGQKWDTYVSQEEYERANEWFYEQKKAGKIATTTVAEIVNAATPAKLVELKANGQAAADGCPIGVGSYGFEQMPGLFETIVVDDNTTVILVLENFDYANRYEATDLKAWEVMSGQVRGETLSAEEGGGQGSRGSNYLAFGERMGYGLCPHYRFGMVRLHNFFIYMFCFGRSVFCF
jgi:hypothetical protein